MSKGWKEEMARRRANPGSIQDKGIKAAEAFKADALKSLAGLKGAELEKAKSEIEKRFMEIATGSRE
jgi:hypothetical protein